MKTSLTLFLLVIFAWPVLAKEGEMSDCSNSKCHQKNLDAYKKMANKHSPFEKMACDSCHSKEHKKLVEAPEKLCYQCHDNYSKNNFVHGPVSTASCTTCHNPHASPNQNMLVKPKGEICAECHDLKPGAHTHKPVTDKNCTGCHSPHGSGFKGLLLKDPSEICSSCHPIKTQEYSHGPYGTGACLGCHAPHSSAENHLLTAPDKELCMSCHEDFAEKMKESTVHTAINKLGCSGCHNPHTSAFRFQLRQDTKALCLGCHDKIQKAVQEAKFKHDPVLQGQACRGCHDPHSSTLNSLLLKPESDLCLSCHNKPLKSSENNKPIADVAASLKDAKEKHGPIRESLCAPCHNAHGSEYFRLLRKPYPEAFYAPFEEKLYGLCFSCHNSQVVLSATTTQLTNFRNGDQNLHYIHVHQKKGRTCRSCHEVHASHLPKHIRYSVPFGKANWNLPLKFVKTETGGGCLPGCHRKYDYDRKTFINNRGSK
jgi:predicted CXXCH cytochrome family protein